PETSSQAIHQTQLPEESRPQPFIPTEEPLPINPDDLEGMFSDLDDSPVQCKPPPAKQTKPQSKHLDPTRDVEHDYFSDDLDPDMLALADSFSAPEEPSISNSSSHQSPLSETSGNVQPPARLKGPEK